MKHFLLLPLVFFLCLFSFHGIGKERIFFGFEVKAQGVPSSIQGINLDLSTENPSPGQTITIRATSYVISLDSANISWSLNSTAYKNGIGITSIQAQAPAIGKKLTVSISATASDGTKADASIVINPGNIDLIMESDGYVPPFFRGKIPPVYQNSYKIIAVPHITNPSGVEYDPRTLVYQWTKDTKVIPSASGYGKQVFSWKDEIVPRPRIISVKVSSRDGSAQAEKTVSFQTKSPFVGFYFNDPLYGPLYNKTLGKNINLGSERELPVLAVPFGFNKSTDSGDVLSFSWMINSLAQTALSANEAIVLRAPEGQSGSSNVSLEVRNKTDILQSAQNAFSAAFSAEEDPDNNIINFNGI